MGEGCFVVGVVLGDGTGVVVMIGLGEVVLIG